MSTKEISTTYFFESSSGGKMYQTQLYDDGTTSCDCNGWTRRNPPGGRSCKHTRLVEAGLGEREAVQVQRFGGAPAFQPKTNKAKQASKPEPAGVGISRSKRKFDFSED